MAHRATVESNRIQQEMLDSQERQNRWQRESAARADVSATAVTKLKYWEKGYILVENRGPAVIKTLRFEPALPTTSFQFDGRELPMGTWKISAKTVGATALNEYVARTPAPRIHWETVGGVEGSSQVEMN